MRTEVSLPGHDTGLHIRGRHTDLTIVSRDHADDVRVCPHDDPGEVCRNTSAVVVGNNEGHVVGPAVVVET